MRRTAAGTTIFSHGYAGNAAGSLRYCRQDPAFVKHPAGKFLIWASLKTEVFRDAQIKNTCFAAHRARNRKGTSENNRFLEVLPNEKEASG
jgi:hypothetical protein